MMNVQELATAVQYGIPAVQLVWEDSEFGLIRWKQDMQFKSHSHTEFRNPDLVKLAAAFGAWSKRINKPDELRPALRKRSRSPIAPR